MARAVRRNRGRVRPNEGRCHVTYAVPAVVASVPIVFAAGGDPIGNGIVASLARPGGNATGFSQSIDLAGKRIEFVRGRP
jgi:ABC-type uncharacterized transport system substrate-binding protein